MQAAKSDEVGSFIDTADAAKEIGKICEYSVSTFGGKPKPTG